MVRLFPYISHGPNPRYSSLVTTSLREKLDRGPYADLEAMMAAHAHAAVDIARRNFHQTLDFTDNSIDRLDEVLVLVSQSPELEIDFEVKLWGSYLGEMLRRRYTGSWEMTTYPGAVSAVPAVEVRGSRLFPLLKVYRRLTLGEEEDLAAFWQLVTQRLGQPAKVN